MSCDGDSVSVTAATLPSLEDVLLGNIPGLPTVHLHNKVLDPSVGGEDFLQPYRQAVDDELEAPFVLVIEGSIPNENINGEGYWTSFGNDLTTGQPLGMHGSCRLPGMGLPLGGRHPDREHPRVSRAAGQLYGDPYVVALPGWRYVADDPARRPAQAHVALREDRPRRL